MAKEDTVGDDISAANAAWSFGGEVSHTFDAHIQKSVPFYQQGHALVAQLSDFFLHDGSVCYDLGCSTGRLLQQIASRHQKAVSYIGCDAEPGMIDKARANTQGNPQISFICDDLLNIELQPADFIVCYYTLQFVPPKHRQLLFDRIYQALNWGGALVLFEKVRGPDARFQDMMTTLYADYKLQQGFSAEEILSKTRSLKGVLEPFSTQGNLDLMKRAGFEDVMTAMKYICFEGFIAIK